MGRRKIYNDPVDRRRERYKAKQRAKYEAYKSSCRCAVCGHKGPDEIGFYHPDQNKSNNVGRLIAQGYSWDTVLIEISKCVPLCRTCHDSAHQGLGEEAILFRRAMVDIEAQEEQLKAVAAVPEEVA